MQEQSRRSLISTAMKSTLAVLFGLATGLLAAAAGRPWWQAPVPAVTPAPPPEYRAMTVCHPRSVGVVDQQQVETSVGTIATDHGRNGWILAEATAYGTPSGLCVLLIFRRP